MKRIFVLFGLLVTIGASINAQQVTLYSQYMFNPFAINPAYAGSRNSMSGVILARQQWAGIDGAPRTGSFAIHSPFKGKNFALGLNGVVESIGPTTQTGVFATYAYHLRLGPGKLSFGLRGGLFNARLNNDQLNYNDPSDVHNTGGAVSQTAPNFDFGAYYYAKKFYVGLSATQLFSTASGFSNNATNGGAANYLKQHFMLASGYAIVINPNFVLKPSTLIKYVNGAPLNVDVNISALFNKVFWAGVSYRTSQSLVLVLEYNITDFIRMGYSYDYALGKLRTYTTGSHELFLGFDLNISNKKSISPRYL